ncbi:hypothetical protein [Kitasatospora sp. GP82]|uniref:hypothetical protein n=1 Tax=Kitasatospora sp. GP82 TaxID=3035089 RepID=UPI00247352CC|nr:hypothetical protein [Kitasatospora sp. GP82]MDH6128249.1 hypothetical protein [Kitasatospora sp. GP82]
MEPELTTLATTAANAVVRLLATESWELARRTIGRLWQRVHPERAETVTAELDDARAELLAARHDGDEQTVRTEQALVDDWCRRLTRLAHAGGPELVDELRRMIDELGPQTPEPDGTGSGDIRMRATASGHGRVYQAGRDQHIVER